MKAVKLGIGSALTASACCLGPAVLAAVGLGGLGLAGWWVYLREARRCVKAYCRVSGGKATLVTLSVASLVVAGFAWMHLGPAVSRAACAISCPRQP